MWRPNAASIVIIISYARAWWFSVFLSLALSLLFESIEVLEDAAPASIVPPFPFPLPSPRPDLALHIFSIWLSVLWCICFNQPVMVLLVSMSRSTCAFWSLIMCTSTRPSAKTPGTVPRAFTWPLLWHPAVEIAFPSAAPNCGIHSLRCWALHRPNLRQRWETAPRQEAQLYALFLCRIEACTTCCLKPVSDCLTYLFSVTVAYAMMSIFYQLLLYGQKQNSSHIHGKNNCYSCSDSI